jgi:hypothetical protein
MAEFTELDGMLRDALQRAAQPGDSTGVADAIRSRVAAGDPGTSVAASTAPGWGGGVSGWLPWLGLIVLAGIGGTALGASGVIAGEPREILAGYTAVLDDSAPAASCPGGPVIDELFAGDRVLAIARSEDSGYLGVRDPNDFARTLWFDRAVVVVDAGQADVDSLPIEACPVATVEVIEPTPVPTEEPEPEPEPEPAPVPSDTTAPSLANANANPKTISMQGFPECGPTASVISVNVTDPGGVQSVKATWTGGSALLNRSGSTWSFSFSEDTIGFTDTNYTITLTATDSSGNVGSTAVAVTVEYCLI